MMDGGCVDSTGLLMQRAQTENVTGFTPHSAKTTQARLVMDTITAERSVQVAEQPAAESEPLERQTGILSTHSVSHQQVLQALRKVPSKQIFSTNCKRCYSHHLRTGYVSTRESTLSTVF